MELQTKKRRLTSLGAALTAAGAAILLSALVFYLCGAKIVRTYFDFEPQNTASGVMEANDAPSIAIPGFESATVPADTKAVGLRLYNPETNDCYFEIAIELTDAGKEIYRSKLLRPGQELTEIELAEGLPAGQYGAILHYYAYSTDGTFTPLNGADVPFTLIAE